MYSRLLLCLSTLSAPAACNLDARQTVITQRAAGMPLNMNCKGGRNTQGLIEIPTRVLRGTLNMHVRVRKHTVWANGMEPREVDVTLKGSIRGI